MNTMAIATGQRASLRPITAILAAGAAAAVLDIIDPIIFHGLRGVPPIAILQSIATGVLGRAAYQGGAASAALGMALHTFILVVAAAIYYLASRRAPVLVTRPLLCGPLFGLAVYGFMRFVVLPLSATTVKHDPSLPAMANMLFAHLFLVGLPIAWIVAKAPLRPAPGSDGHGAPPIRRP